MTQVVSTYMFMPKIIGDVQLVGWCSFGMYLGKSEVYLGPTEGLHAT